VLIRWNRLDVEWPPGNGAYFLGSINVSVKWAYFCDICETSQTGRSLLRTLAATGVFVTIRGRAKRFAKIGGEMVSLAAVESLAQGLWPESNHAAVVLPDQRKGEQIVLVTEEHAADREALAAHGRAQGLPELWLPRAVLVAPIPIAGSGKIDYTATREMVQRLILDPLRPRAE
jgi:acyl-CoA synthetase (AMP-forming)/AMP-acid ligase II